MAQPHTSTTFDEIVTQLTPLVWADMGNEDKAPIPTGDDLRRWMPPFNVTLALPFFRATDGLMLETGIMPDKAPEPDHWQEQVWYRVKRCIAQHARDFPAQLDTDMPPPVAPVSDITKTTKTNHRLFTRDLFYDPTTVENADEIKPRTEATIATIAILDGWKDNKKAEIQSLEAGVEAIDRLCAEVEQRHPGEFRVPLASIVRQWLTETTAKPITEEYDRRHPAAIIKGEHMGSIRDFIVSDNPVDSQGLGQLKGISAPAPNTDQIEIPGLETKSVLPAVLPLQAVHIHDGMENNRRGAVAMPIRLFFEAIMALEPHETQSTIRFKLGDLLYYLNHDRKYHRTRHLPHVLNGLHSLYWLRIPYRSDPDKPSTEVDWIPVLPRSVPNLQSGDDASIILEVKLSPDARSGTMVVKEIIRRLGKYSSSQLNAYLSASGLFDKYGTVNGKIIDPTKPRYQRDAKGYLVKPDGTPIFTATGRRIKDPYHPQAVSQLDREPNQARERYPTLSFDDLLRACFPKGYPKGEKAKYLKRSKKAWTELEAEGVIQIERFKHGWRIMPSESHIGLHRALRQSSNTGG